MTINGVRVLAQEVINETPDFVLKITVLLVGCMFLFGILALIVNGNWAITASIICGIAGFLWIMFAGACGVFNRPFGRSTYKCIFDEDVSIQEVYDKYEVVGRDGDIWILEDKE